MLVFHSLNELMKYMLVLKNEKVSKIKMAENVHLVNVNHKLVKSFNYLQALSIEPNNAVSCVTCTSTFNQRLVFIN